MLGSMGRRTKSELIWERNPGQNRDWKDKVYNAKEGALTLSLWKGRNTNRPRNRSAPVLREMTTGVSRPQVVLATDLATAVRLAKDGDLLKLSPSTLFPDLRPAKLACTAARETTFLLPDRTGTPVVVTLEVAEQAAISYQERKKTFQKTKQRDYFHNFCCFAHRRSSPRESNEQRRTTEWSKVSGRWSNFPDTWGRRERRWSANGRDETGG
jgi:hypothetical protein